MEALNISFYCWLPKSGFSGGRYLSLCLANSLADSGCNVDFFTNETNSHMALTCFENSKVNFKTISTQTSSYDFGIIIPNGPGSYDFYNLFLDNAINLNHKNIFYNFESGNWWNAQSPYKKDISLWDPWKKVAKLCDTILSISRTGNQWAKEFYDNQDFIYEPGPININYEKPNLVKSKKVFIMSRFGATSVHKGWNQLHLLNTKVLSNFEIILNTGNVNLNQDIKNNISNLFSKNEIKVTFRHSISEKEKKQLMKESSFLFFATEFEGLGMPPLEAISLGTNVLCSDIPVLRETGEGFYVFFDNKSANIDHKIEQALHKKIPFEEVVKFNNKHSMSGISNSLITKLHDRKKK